MIVNNPKKGCVMYIFHAYLTVLVHKNIAWKKCGKQIIEVALSVKF